MSPVKDRRNAFKRAWKSVVEPSCLNWKLVSLGTHVELFLLLRPPSREISPGCLVHDSMRNDLRLVKSKFGRLLSVTSKQIRCNVSKHSQAPNSS